MQLAPVLVTGPTKPVLTVGEVKAHLRVTVDDEDAVISALAEAARRHLEDHRGILDGLCFLTQTWRQDFSAFTSGGRRFLDPISRRLRLGLRPVQSISSVTYYDSNNDQQTLSTSIYELLTDSQGPYVAEKPDQDWPTTYSRDDAVRITYVTGFGDNASDVPEDIRLAMKIIIADWFYYRESFVVGSRGSTAIAKIPGSAEDILASYRSMVF